MAVPPCRWDRPTDVPAVSTFYAFLRRLYPEAMPPQGGHATLLRPSTEIETGSKDAIASLITLRNILFI